LLLLLLLLKHDMFGTCVVAQCRAAGWLVSVVFVHQLYSRLHTQCQTTASAGAEEPDLSHHSSLATDMVSHISQVLAAKARFSMMLATHFNALWLARPNFCGAMALL